MDEPTSLTGRTAVVTGAGAGLGRAEALSLAARGAAVVVNDIGGGANDVADEIGRSGGQAIAVVADVGEWSTGQRLVDTAIDGFGGLDIVMNNAGVTRDAMLFNLTESQWDDVIRIHLKGHAAVSRAAGAYWRGRSKEIGGPVFGRVVNTTSEAFLFGSAGQPNYAAAKAGITALTLSTAQGLSRYGVTTNAICPRARTDMTANVFAGDPRANEREDILAPERVAAFVCYLASEKSEKINGQVFIVYGDMIALLSPATVERKFTAAGGSFTVEEIDQQLSAYFAERQPGRTFSAYELAKLDDTGVPTVTIVANPNQK